MIAERLTKVFGDNVDGFTSFSLSVRNRRKSRVGFALENHLEVVFAQVGPRYERTATTEGRSKPYFLFPGSKEYQTAVFPALLLTMLGVKSACKDRWRQVLAEAAISRHQTDEMCKQKLQLVVLRGLHRTYNQSQQSWLLDIAQFTELVREKQKRTDAV